MDEKLTVSVLQAASMLDISRSLAYEMVRQQIIPSIRLGRRLLIPLKSLGKMLEDGVNLNTSERI